LNLCAGLAQGELLTANDTGPPGGDRSSAVALCCLADGRSSGVIALAEIRAKAE